MLPPLAIPEYVAHNVSDRLFATIKNTIVLFVPPKFCIGIVSSFSRDHFKSQEKIKTTLMQNTGGSNNEYYGIFDTG